MFPRRQLEREDLTITIEQGRKVEQAQFREDTRKDGWQTMPEYLIQLVWAKNEEIRLWEKRREHFPSRVYEAGPNPHTFPCEDPLCTRCDEGVKRLLRDCDLLPVGEPNRAGFTVTVKEGRMVKTRYREDRSDR